MERLTTDILVAGGGIAGLAASAAMASCGLEVICVEPSAPITNVTDDGADLRSTAFLEPSIDLLQQAGLWAVLAPHATDLRIMRLADAGGPEAEVREQADFDAAELGRARFGCNLPNWLLRSKMTETVTRMPGVTLISRARVTDLVARSSEAIVRLDTGQQVRAKLAIAADGRNSVLRQSAGIGLRRWAYGQKAMVFAVSHPLPHRNISTEIHRTGGPFTLVPLPDQDGVPHSAVVWMERGPEAVRLAELGTAEFETAMNDRSCGVLGPLSLASPRRTWPIISQYARRLDGPRLALVAEAAHVVPPIGAQGLNMSLADIRALRDLVASAHRSGGDIGAPELLSEFHRQRHADIVARVTGIDILNRAAMAEAPMLRDLRTSGLRFLSKTLPIRRAAMQGGLGLSATTRTEHASS